MCLIDVNILYMLQYLKNNYDSRGVLVLVSSSFKISGFECGLCFCVSWLIALEIWDEQDI